MDGGIGNSILGIYNRDGKIEDLKVRRKYCSVWIYRTGPAAPERIFHYAVAPGSRHQE